MRPLSFLVVLVAVLIASGWQYRADLGLFGEGQHPVGAGGVMGAGQHPVGSAGAAEDWLTELGPARRGGLPLLLEGVCRCVAHDGRPASASITTRDGSSAACPSSSAFTTSRV